MISRFLSNLWILLLAAGLVALSLGLPPAAVSWIGVGVGSAVVVITAGAFLSRDRGAVQRGLDGPVALIAGWMIISSRTFAGTPIRWMAFAEGVILVVLAVVGLIAHEALSERAVHRMFGDSRVAGDLVVQRRTVTLRDGEV